MLVELNLPVQQRQELSQGGPGRTACPHASLQEHTPYQIHLPAQVEHTHTYDLRILLYFFFLFRWFVKSRLLTKLCSN
jgi:hypothetical protein